MSAFNITKLIVVALSLAAPLPSKAQPSQLNTKTTFMFGDHRYQFPSDTHTNDFRDRTGAWMSSEVLVYHKFWTEVFGRVAPIDGWMAFGDNTGPWMIYLTRPSDLFQFFEDKDPNLPPVRGPVKLKGKQGSMMFWMSLDPNIHIDGLTYVTFDERDDLYVSCEARDIGDWQRSCDVLWNDRGVVHNFGIAGDWIARVPQVVDSYRQTVLSENITPIV